MARGKVIQRIIELKDKFSPNLKKMNTGTLQFKREVRDLKKVGAASFKAIGTGLAATGAAALALGTAGLVAASKFGKLAGEIDTASMRAGVSTGYLQEMRYAMDQVGVSSDVLDRVLKRTNQRMGMAAQGNKGYKDALDKMGVAIHDTNGNLRSAEDVFDDAIDSLSRMTDSQEQAALAGKFFGVMASQNLLPAIQAGGDELRKMREEARELGIVIEDDLIQAGAAFDSSMTKLKQSLTGVFYALASPALPLFNRGIDWLSSKIPVLREYIVRTFDSLKNALNENRERFNVFLNMINNVKNSILGAFSRNGEGGGAIAWFIDNAIPAMIDGVARVLEGIANTYYFVRDNWSLIGPIVYSIVGAWAAYHAITKAVTVAKLAQTAAMWALNTAMNMSPIGWIITAIGLLIAAGVFLMKNWDDVKLAAKKTWNGIVSFVEWGVNSAIGFINFLISGAIAGLNWLIRAANKIPGVNISEISFGGFDKLDFGAAKFDTEGQTFNWGKREEEEPFEDLLAKLNKEQELNVKAHYESNDELIDSLDYNSEMLKTSAGKINDIHVTLYASDMTAEEIAQKLVPKLRRELFG